MAAVRAAPFRVPPLRPGGGAAGARVNNPPTPAPGGGSAFSSPSAFAVPLQPRPQRLVAARTSSNGGFYADDDTREHIFVIGAGNAAGYFCKRVVEAAEAGEAPMPRLTVIGEELSAPYERPALTKAFLHKTNPARLPGFLTSRGIGAEVQTKEWYKEKGIELRLCECVVGSNFENQTLLTAARGPEGLGGNHTYDKLVIACGVRARFLPPEIGGALNSVHYVRNELDALALYSSLERDSVKRVCVIGGGYIGMECTAAIAAWGIPTTMVFMEPHIMPRLFTAEIAEHYEKVYTDLYGVNIKASKELWYINASGMSQEDDVDKVVLSQSSGSEEIPCDAVVVGMGIDVGGSTLGPLRKLTDIKVAGDEGVDPMRLQELTDAFSGVGGIATNSSFKVTHPGSKGIVWAIGDVAAFPLLLDDGAPTRVEHVDHARKSAAVAAESILGLNPPPYDYMPYYYSRIFEEEGSKRPVHWVFYGLQKGNPEDVIVVGDFKPQLVAFWNEGGRVTGVFLESGTNEQVAKLDAVSRSKPQVDMKKLRASKTVQEALDLVCKGITATAKEAAAVGARTT